MSSRFKFANTYWVIIIATVGFLGLSILQVINLDSTLETNRQIFKQKVHLASAKISKTFMQDATYSNLLHEAAKRVQSTKQIKDSEMDQVLRALIDPTIKNYGITIPYEYAIYSDKASRKGYDFLMGDDGTNPDFQLATCEYPDKKGHGWVTLTCSSTGSYHLALFFPDQEKHIFAQTQNALILTAVFIIMLIGCFSYTILVIRKQKKLSEIKNDFINNLTHEFKTPIASINLSANMLQRGGNTLEDEKRINYLNLIDQESKRLEGQVDKILQIAMLDSGNFSLEKEEINIHDIIHSVVKSLSLAIDQRQGDVKLTLNAENSIVKGDHTHLVNIIYNLVDNALKYTIKTPHIEITTSNEAEGIKISIRDNGVGIGEEIQKFIFDKFYRADTGDIHRVKGFGLGLSYVKKLVDAHKGKIGVNSVLDEGSEFQVYFPSY